MRERWRSPLTGPEARVLLAEEDEGPVGLAYLAPERLDGLYVVPRLWGAGVAGLLHDEVVAALRGMGCVVCRLRVLKENERARRFYQRRGWCLDGRTRDVPFPPHPLDVGYTLELRA